MNILVYNLSFNLIDSDIRRMFSAFGVVNSAEVVKDKLNGRSKGKALIEMPVEAEGQQAIVSLDQTVIDGKKISVQKEAFFSDWN
jgi:RNA recognition motif-containing protein